jgi:uncharacterized protein (TIGR02302 family)
MDETGRHPTPRDMAPRDAAPHDAALRDAAFHRIRRAVALTRAGIVAERFAGAFWPAWTAALALGAAVAFGAFDALAADAARWLLAAGIAATLGLAVAGLLRFRWPSRAETVARLDATLRGRPLAALADRPATGAEDAGARAVWTAHVARMAARAATAQAPRPDLRLARADRFALRYMALTAAVMAILFGATGRIADLPGLAPRAAGAAAAGPVWEGWINPPDYTGKPAIYLNEIAAGSLDLPQGSRVTLRFYGDPGAFRLDETVSGNPVATDDAGGARFLVERDGRIAITGPGPRTWEVTLLPDRPPEIRATGAMMRAAEGTLALGFAATDDHGVVAGSARITLDLAAVDRRHGLAAEPEPRPAIELDLPMPFAGDRTEVLETLAEDLSKHPFANLPVRVHLAAEDAIGQTGKAAPIAGVLPGRRFFDPLAAAIIEMRRDILWSAANARRSAQVLRAVTHAPEGFIRNERAFLRLRVALRRLEAATPGPALRDEVAEELWQIALLVEEGDLASALERLRRAQDRLDQAMREGASESEIQELMDELRAALDRYMRQLAEEAARDPEGALSENRQELQMSGNQLQELLDRLQQLMEEGRMAEAAELMELLRQLTENMQVTQGQGQGEGEGSQAMRELAETLRDQQGLSDEAFRDLQRQFNDAFRDLHDRSGEGEGQGQRPGEGMAEGEGENPGGSLADRQRALRDRLGGLDRGALPGEGSAQGEAGRQALDRAGRAMSEAERRLREGDLPGALDRQGEALDALREGIENLGEALAEDQRRQNGGQPGEQFGDADPRGQRDPLGRTQGLAGRLATDESLLQGEAADRRARELVEELRRRSGEQERGEAELDYLRRLLERF